jgi:hypothetical protein
MTHDYSHQSTDEDQRMMAFFDSLVQREIESWSSEDLPTPQSPSDPENNNTTDRNHASDSEGKYLYRLKIFHHSYKITQNDIYKPCYFKTHFNVLKQN